MRISNRNSYNEPQIPKWWATKIAWLGIIVLACLLVAAISGDLPKVLEMIGGLFK